MGFTDQSSVIKFAGSANFEGVDEFNTESLYFVLVNPARAKDDISKFSRV